LGVALSGNIASIAVSSMIVLAASTVGTSFMTVRPVSRSIAPWMFSRTRPLLCSYRVRARIGAS